MSVVIYIWTTITFAPHVSGSMDFQSYVCKPESAICEGMNEVLVYRIQFQSLLNK